MINENKGEIEWQKYLKVKNLINSLDLTYNKLKQLYGSKVQSRFVIVCMSMRRKHKIVCVFVCLQLEDTHTYIYIWI